MKIELLINGDYGFSTAECDIPKIAAMQCEEVEQLLRPALWAAIQHYQELERKKHI